MTTAAAGLGIATVHDDGTVIEVWYPHTSVDPETVSMCSEGVGGATGTSRPDGNPYDGPMRDAYGQVVAAADSAELLPNLHAEAVVTVLDDLTTAPEDAADVYLRLSLLSNRWITPHGANLDDAFALLTNVAWTNGGPVRAADLPDLRLELMQHGQRLQVRGVDKFPRMTDHVVPSGVRIADADRVRLGAHLAEGTTVMHEGFVNFNAGTLGATMIEGRISSGVVVGHGSDLGGGASIMGTLSGGGSEVIRIGKDCLVGANAGVGISLGDGCIIEAGLYVTGGTKVRLPDGDVVAARQLTGSSGLLFRRNSLTGAVEVLEREGGWGSLNAALHSN